MKIYFKSIYIYIQICSFEGTKEKLPTSKYDEGEC